MFFLFQGALFQVTASSILGCVSFLVKSDGCGVNFYLWIEFFSGPPSYSPRVGEGSSVSSVEFGTPKKTPGCLLPLLVEVMGFKQVQLKGIFLLKCSQSYPVTLQVQFFAISRSIFLGGFSQQSVYAMKSLGF